jgi:hypothetical protein
LSDGKGGVRDITNKVTVGGSSATWQTESFSIGRYQLIFTIDGFAVASSVITLTEPLALNSVSYAINGK